MSDIIKLRDGSAAPSVLGSGEVAIDEVGRLLYLKTLNGVVSMPLDRAALSPSDENASGEVYVYRENGIADRVVLDAGGGANYRDDRNWRVYGVAPKAIGSGGMPQSGVFEVTTPTTIQSLRVRVLSGTGTLSLNIYEWDGARGALIFQDDVAVSGAGSYVTHLTLSLEPGRYQAVVDSGSVISIETLIGLLPWAAAPQYIPFHMAESAL